MQLCSLSITYACPYHNPTATMGHSIHNVQQQQTAHPHDAIYAVWHLPCYSANRDSSMKRTPLKVPGAIKFEHLPTQVGLRWRTAVRSRPRWGWRAWRWASLRLFLTVCAEILWLCKPIVAAVVRVAVVRRSWGEDARCGGPGLVWLHVVCGYETSWMFCQILWISLETAYGRVTNIQFTGNSSGGHSCQNANCTLPQNLQHLWHCAVG